MPNNVQEFAQSASNYRNLTLKKNLAKKRGRACNRQEKRNGTVESRIIRDALALGYARKEFRKEMKQFEKTVSEAGARGIHDIPMPEFLSTLRDNARLAENNLEAAKISKAAMDRFPPMSRKVAEETNV